MGQPRRQRGNPARCVARARVRCADRDIVRAAPAPERFARAQHHEHQCTALEAGICSICESARCRACPQLARPEARILAAPACPWERPRWKSFIITGSALERSASRARGTRPCAPAARRARDGSPRTPRRSRSRSINSSGRRESKGRSAGPRPASTTSSQRSPARSPRNRHSLRAIAWRMASTGRSLSACQRAAVSAISRARAAASPRGDCAAARRNRPMAAIPMAPAVQVITKQLRRSYSSTWPLPYSSSKASTSSPQSLSATAAHQELAQVVGEVRRAPRWRGRTRRQLGRRPRKVAHDTAGDRSRAARAMPARARPPNVRCARTTRYRHSRIPAPAPEQLFRASSAVRASGAALLALQRAGAATAAADPAGTTIPAEAGRRDLEQLRDALVENALIRQLVEVVEHPDRWASRSSRASMSLIEAVPERTGRLHRGLAGASFACGIERGHDRQKRGSELSCSSSVSQAVAAGAAPHSIHELRSVVLPLARAEERERPRSRQPRTGSRRRPGAHGAPPPSRTGPLWGCASPMRCAGNGSPRLWRPPLQGRSHPHESPTMMPAPAFRVCTHPRMNAFAMRHPVLMGHFPAGAVVHCAPPVWSRPVRAHLAVEVEAGSRRCSPAQHRSSRRRFPRSPAASRPRPEPAKSPCYTCCRRRRHAPATGHRACARGAGDIEVVAWASSGAGDARGGRAGSAQVVVDVPMPPTHTNGRHPLAQLLREKHPAIGVCFRPQSRDGPHLRRRPLRIRRARPRHALGGARWSCSRRSATCGHGGTAVDPLVVDTLVHARDEPDECRLDRLTRDRRAPGARPGRRRSRTTSRAALAHQASGREAHRRDSARLISHDNPDVSRRVTDAAVPARGGQARGEGRFDEQSRSSSPPGYLRAGARRRAPTRSPGRRNALREGTSTRQLFFMRQKAT